MGLRHLAWVAGLAAAGGGPGPLGCVPRGAPLPGETPVVVGTDATVEAGTDAMPGTDAAPGPDAALPPVHWGWVLVQDHETVADALYAVFYDTADVPLPAALLESEATAVKGAPGCWINPLDAYPSTGVPAGPLSFSGLAVSPVLNPVPVPRYVWSGGGGELFTGAVWGFSGPGGGAEDVAPFGGSDVPPDTMELSTSDYDPVTRTYVATWTPGNGTHVGVVVLSPVNSAEAVCLYPDSAGAGMVPGAAVDALVPGGDTPLWVGALRMRILLHDTGTGTAVWAIGKSGWLEEG